MPQLDELMVVDCEASDAPAAFTRSLRETGFGVLRRHPLPADLIAQLYQRWAQFFASETKHRFAFDPKTQEGYISAQVSESAKGSQTKDLKEFYHVYPWGKIPEDLRTITLSYYALAGTFAGRLLHWIEACTPEVVRANLPMPLASMIEASQQSLLRIINYPAQDREIAQDALRAAAHEDINLLTVLPAATEPGLQVMRKDGTWMDAPNDRGLLIVNIGDMLSETTRGYYPSTTHRVQNPPPMLRHHARISMPLFLHPRPEVRLSSRYTADSYLKERLAELGF